MDPKDSDRLSPSAAPLDSLSLSSGSSEVSYLLPFAGDLNGAKIHVHSPTSVIFICGGKCSSHDSKTPLSLRDAFMKIGEAAFVELDEAKLLPEPIFIIAERITSKFDFGRVYSDYFEFEIDLAQIAEIILLFCESIGSFAELGAFASVKDIAGRLLVVLLDGFWDEDSFIKYGPIQLLRSKYGEASTFVLDQSEINANTGSYEKIDLTLLQERLKEPIAKRMERRHEKSTFESSRAGHMVKLLVGLIQEYGALKLVEIHDLLTILDIHYSVDNIRKYLFCATEVNWIANTRRGEHDYFVARNVRDAASFKVGKSARESNKTRRRFLIRQHWMQNEPLRNVLIRDVFQGLTR